MIQRNTYYKTSHTSSFHMFDFEGIFCPECLNIPTHLINKTILKKHQSQVFFLNSINNN